MRHAAVAADAALLGRIMIEAGGIRIYVRDGPVTLLAADRCLMAGSLEIYPRLIWARMVALILMGRLPEARRTCDSAQSGSAVAKSDGDVELRIDRCLALAIITHQGSEPVGSTLFETSLDEARWVSNLPDIEPTISGMVEYHLCIAHGLKAEFGAALSRGARARACIEEHSPHLSTALNFQLGQIAMAQGRVEAAADWYQSGLLGAMRRILHSERLSALGKTLLRELSLERNTIEDDAEPAQITEAFWRSSKQFSGYAAASTVAVEATLRAAGVDGALSVIGQMREQAQRAELPAFERYLSGMHVAVLTAAGQIGKAEQRWRSYSLPRSHSGCIDLGHQTWREMEVISCARLQLHISRGEFEDGRQLAGELIALSTGRSLRRTSMRALALATVLEESARRPSSRPGKPHRLSGAFRGDRLRVFPVAPTAGGGGGVGGLSRWQSAVRPVRIGGSSDGGDASRIAGCARPGHPSINRCGIPTWPLGRAQSETANLTPSPTYSRGSGTAPRVRRGGVPPVHA